MLFIQIISLFVLDSIPTKCLPNQGGHQEENDYIYYDREVSDTSASIMVDRSEDTKSTEISPEIKNDNKGYTHKMSFMYLLVY